MIPTGGESREFVDASSATVFDALNIDDAGRLASLLGAARPDYIKDFYPFKFEKDVITRLLENAVDDQYWAVRAGRELAGFFMLRGFDAGYERPSFGIFIDEDFGGRGRAGAALDWTLDWSRQRRIASIMLKVVHDNDRARRIYVRAGFEPFGICPDSGQLMMEIRLDPGTRD